jgi:hypothetical protein
MEIAIVILIVAATLVWTGRRAYLTLSGKSTGCCGKCSECPACTGPEENQP